MAALPPMPNRGAYSRSVMIEITDRIALNEAEIVVTFIRAGGPDGQNVNKVSSASQLRFDVRRSPSYPKSSACASSGLPERG